MASKRRRPRTKARKSTRTERKVRKVLRRGAQPFEGGWYKLDPKLYRENLDELVAYLRKLPGGRRSATFKLAVAEFSRVRARLIVHPEDWIARSIELASKRPLKVVRELPDGLMGSRGPYARSLAAKSADADADAEEAYDAARRGERRSML